MFKKIKAIWEEKKQDKILEKEIRLVREIAEKYLKEAEQYQEEHPMRIKTKTLRRMCKYILWKEK